VPDADSRESAVTAARTALRSSCWRLQAAALDALKRSGAVPADPATLPSFLRDPAAKPAR